MSQEQAPIVTPLITPLACICRSPFVPDPSVTRRETRHRWPGGRTRHLCRRQSAIIGHAPVWQSRAVGDLDGLQQVHAAGHADATDGLPGLVRPD